MAKKLNAKKLHAFSIQTHIVQAYIQNEQTLIRNIVSDYAGKVESKKITRVFERGNESRSTLFYDNVNLGTIERVMEDNEYVVSFIPTK